MSYYAISNVSRFRLRAHTLTVETASWEDGISAVCDRCSCEQIQDEAHGLFMCRHEGLCALRQKFSKLFWTCLATFHLHILSCSINLVSRLYLISSCNAIRSFSIFYFMSELLDLLLAGTDQPQADQPNSLAGSLPL